MGATFAVIFVLLQWLLLVQLSSALPLCNDLRAPTKAESGLEFCGEYNGGSTCCDSMKDAQLKKQWSDMNISDSSCASLLKSILCAQCDPFSADLFKAKTGPQKQQQQQRSLPLLCNSTTTTTTTNSSHSSKSTTTSFCSTVWTACKSTPIPNSPFAPSLQGGGNPSPTTSAATLSDLWQSETTFCDIFGGAATSSAADTPCFDGAPVKLENTTTPDSGELGLCLERLGDGSYINMAPHPDGSGRAFFSNLKGEIWLADLPDQDSGAELGLDESDPFVDLTDHVLFDTMFGMLGIAFHPNFAENGRFFASYNCDRLKSPACAGRCACNSDVDCDPSTVNGTAQNAPCQFQSVVAEFSANGTASNPGQAKTAKPTEVRRIFTMGLPFTTDHGGQILFGPEDGYLYLMMGDGGGKNDPYNFAQNKKSVLGKILRLDVDNIPSQKEINELGLWGSYSIPRDNPYLEDKELAQEIWAMGFRNPWRCSFDAQRPSYFVCADVGQDLYEEVDLVTKGGNYGWGTYEGPILSTPRKVVSATNDSSLNHSLIFPVAGYTHEEINKKVGSAAISGGFFYRADTDPCMSARYLYGDLYASNIWAATETPTNSGNFTTKALPFSCARDSPMNCTTAPGTSMPALGYIYSFGQDNKKDVYILASTGVYRVVRPSRCNYACSKEIKRPDQQGPGTPGPSSGPSGAQMVRSHGMWLVSLVVSFFLLDCLVKL